jgi:SAM-dependent methyltransferase
MKKGLWGIFLLAATLNVSAVLKRENLIDNIKATTPIAQKGGDMEVQEPALAQISLKTHLPEGDNKVFEHAYEAIKSRITARGDLPDVTVEEQLKILEELSKFRFGQFLIANSGINGYWTRHMVLYPEHPRSQDAFEQWLLEKCPGVLGTQERFRIFRHYLQEQVKDSAVLASIPCGTMDDLSGLNFDGIKNIRLVGIDLDPSSLIEAAKTALEKGLSDSCSFEQKDAWNLGKAEAFDVITSNGLNFYEPNDQTVTDLYRQFYQALKPNGMLITSFMTPSPLLSSESSWKMQDLNLEDLRRQKTLFAHVLEAKFQVYRTESETREQLKAAGFSDVEVIYDSKGLFPTVIARK